MSFTISGHTISTGSLPFVIAEMSGNHNQSLERALSIVDAAAASGVDAIKLQTYTPDTMTLNVRGGSFDINDDRSLWNGKNLYDLYGQAYTPWDWHRPIFQRAKEHGLICFSSPFDESAVDFLESLDVPLYKIASFENNHVPLLKKVAATGKPVILSTGMATLSDIDLAVTTLRSNGCSNIVLLKCTSTYPASPENSNLATIPHLRETFGVDVGLSDHTLGCGVAVASVSFGSCVIEKHFTLSRKDGGVDSEFSLEPQEFTLLVQEVRNAWQAIGSISYGPSKAESKSLMFRRSIYVSSDIKPGDIFTTSNIRVVRPGDGAPPSLYEHILGRTSKHHHQKGSPLSLDNLI